MDSVGRSLSTIWTIFKKEFNLYFISPQSYIIGAVWLFVSNLIFILILAFFINAGQAEPSLDQVFGSMIWLMVFIAPALSMRLVSGELSAGTHELLFTSPIRDWEIVVGKWLAVWAVFTIFVILMLPEAAILLARGNPDPGLFITGYLGLWLFGGAALAIGVLASTLTQYQPVAFIITMATLLALWLSSNIARIFIDPTISDVFRELSITSHYDSLVRRAVIDPMDIAYFVGMIVLSLFLATQILSTRRWSS